MKMKIALGMFLVSMSASVFAAPHSYDRDDRYNRDHRPHRVERACFLNGKAYSVGSVVKEYRRVKVCERVRGRAMWIDRHHRR